MNIAVTSASAHAAQRRRLITALALAVLHPGIAADQGFPARPLRIVVGGATGTVDDAHARKIGDRLAASLGQPVIVENRPGASGILAAEAVANAKPDGYTLLLANVPMLSINPAVYRKLPYDAQRSFAPVSGLVRGTPLLLVSRALPVRTVAELVALARARPGKLSYGSPGVGSVLHLAMKQLEQLHGLQLLHIPYRSGADAVNDLIGGRTEVQVNWAAVAQPHVHAGRLRALAVVGGVARKPALPDVPTAAELGMPAFDATAWSGFVAPAGTPPGVVARLNREIVAAVRAQDYLDWLTLLGGEPIAGTPAEFAHLIEAEFERWGKVVQAAGVTVE
ncbi:MULTISPECIES: Bug family tripartite tricarboxylate transporter substrate binding protein [Ramlibacter]|nr:MULTISPECIES: tripartite tricarboxylate transporter substrate binding protein [Ramlibacter]MBA2965136.1 tripartite tricarboxylate transporter substrate binding protein [Ramlibacter sp. CGMCC 1.13660]